MRIGTRAFRRSLAVIVVCAWIAGVPVPAAEPADPLPFAGAKRAAAELPRLHSLLASWRGELLLEHYARGRRATDLANVKSVAKSVISTLVGIAIARGLIDNVETPVASFFPELRRDPHKRAITIEDLVTMRSGLASTSGRNYGAWVTSRNWVRYALGRPMVSEPGTSMEYSTGTSHLLSAILTKVSGTSTWQFARDALARPLGITLARWPQDPQGIYFGGNEMLMTPRQMVALGELYLNEGRANGRQVVPVSWVHASCTPVTTSRWNSDRQYGYGWWIREFAGETACFAWGFGGQYIFVFQDLDLVIVTTSNPNVSDERRGHRRMLFDLIEEHVLPVALAANND